MSFHRFLVWTAAILTVSLPLLPASARVQDKLLAGIVGDYDLQLNTRTLPFKIVLKEGKFYFDALVPGGEPPLLAPVQGKDLTFKTYDPNDDEIVLTFTRDPQGKITGCTVAIPVRNIEATAVKVVRS